jgi:hypothetical protein
MAKSRKNEIWEAYQKEIADNHYYFARSCIRQNFFQAAEGLYLIKMLRLPAALIFSMIRDRLHVPV